MMNMVFTGEMCSVNLTGIKIFYIFAYVIITISKQASMISLFVIDDHFLIGSGFREEFEPAVDSIRIVGYAPDLPSAVKAIETVNVNIIVLDLFIKFQDPVANIRLLRSRFPNIPVVILSFEDSLEWQCRMFNEGAMGFLHKSDGKETMKEVFKQVNSGRIVIPENVARLNNSNVGNIPKQLLFPDEKEVIQELSDGFTIKEIASARGKTSSSIEKMLRRIRDRFHARTTYELIIFLTKAKCI